MRSLLLIAVISVGFTIACGGDAGPEPARGEMLVALDDQHGSTAGSRIHLIDAGTGEIAGRLEAGYQTWALFRPSADELLVSDLGGDDSHGRLLVYDLADLSAPKWQMQMRERVTMIGYGPAWALSADERFLYYTVHPRDERDEPQRLANVVAVVDLEARREVVRTEVPSFCPDLSPRGKHDVLAVCHNRLVSVAPDGSVLHLVVPPLRLSAAPDPSGFWHSAVHGGISRDGAYLIFGNGEVVFSRDDGVPAMDMIPGDDQRLYWRGTWAGERQANEGNALLAAGPLSPENYAGMLFDNLLVFEPDKSSQPRRLALPDGITHAAPLGEDRMALIQPDAARIYILDLESGDIMREIHAPAGARWLVGF